MGKKVIAVDVGGTSIKLGLVNVSGGIDSRLELPTLVGIGEDAIVKQIADGIESMIHSQAVARHDILGVGLGVPGLLDPSTGIVTMAPNIGWTDYPAKSKLEKLIQLPVYVDNDANCAALGERWLGAGEMAENMIMVTIGTGVGGGIIVHGKVVSGKQGIGGEIGHITIKPDGQMCGCGKMGCLETEASATAIRRKAIMYLEQGNKSALQIHWEQQQQVTPRQVVEAAQADDPLAVLIFDQVACDLALVLSGLTHALHPEKIIIGGGISYTGAPLFNPLRKYFKRFTLRAANHEHLIVSAKLGNDAGMIGAAFNVITNRM